MQELLQQHRRKRDANKRSIEAAKQEALQAGRRANGVLLMALSRDVVQVHRRQGTVDEQTADLAAETERFLVQTRRWAHAHDALDGAVEKLRGVGAWADQIELQLADITDALEATNAVGSSVQ